MDGHLYSPETLFGHPMNLQTKRLLLRNWEDRDLKPFLEMGQDERVMKYFPNLMSEEDCKTFIATKQAVIDKNGWGFWAAEDLRSKSFVGVIGIVFDELPIKVIQSPRLEIGWRLRPEWWHQGLATEAARACLQFGFETVRSSEIIAVTALSNLPSIRVMQKLGMSRNTADDFDHPRVPEGHPLQRHLVYRLTKEEWGRLHR
jgi:RimJ/RimL family protein N-acetyltransferase